MLSKRLWPVKAFFAFAAAVVAASPNSAVALNIGSEAVELVGKVGDVAKEYPKLKTIGNAASYSSEAIDAGSRGAAGEGLGSTALVMTSSQIGAKVGSVVFAAAGLKLGAKYVVPLKVAGAYLGGKAGAEIGEHLVDWQKTHQGTSPAAIAGASPAGQTNAGSYSFEGTWAQAATASACRNASYAYTRSTKRSTVDPDDACTIKSVKSGADGSTVLSMVCNDATGGDGAPRFAVTETLRFNGPDAMVIEARSGNGETGKSAFQRCPATGATVQQAQSATSPQPRLDQAQPGKATILTAIAAGDEQALKNALRSNLPGYSCNANGSELICQNEQMTVTASIQKKTLSTYSEITPNPDRFPQAQPFLQTLDRLGEAIGLAPGEVKLCRSGPSGQRSKKTNGLLSYCVQKTHFTTQIELGIKPDTSF